jgi:HEAT repeat protein
VEALRRSLAYREISLEGTRIDYVEKGTVEAVLKTLEEKEERSVLFGLELAEKLDPKVIVARLPLALLRHPSATVRSRAIRLFALRPNREILEEIKRMLEDENKEVQAEAISAAAAIFRESAIPLVRPYRDNPDPQIRRRALECLLRYGDPADRGAALNSIGIMASDGSPQGQPGRIEAARTMGEVNHAAFPAHLSRLIREDPSYEVIREAMAAAGKMHYRGSVVRDIIFRLC